MAATVSDSRWRVKRERRHAHREGHMSVAALLNRLEKLEDRSPDRKPELIWLDRDAPDYEDELARLEKMQREGRRLFIFHVGASPGERSPRPSPT